MTKLTKTCAQGVAWSCRGRISLRSSMSFSQGRLATSSRTGCSSKGAGQITSRFDAIRVKTYNFCVRRMKSHGQIIESRPKLREFFGGELSLLVKVMPWKTRRLRQDREIPINLCGSLFPPVRIWRHTVASQLTAFEFHSLEDSEDIGRLFLNQMQCRIERHSFVRVLPAS